MIDISLIISPANTESHDQLCVTNHKLQRHQLTKVTFDRHLLDGQHLAGLLVKSLVDRAIRTLT